MSCEPIFSIEVTCPICGKVWSKPCYMDFRDDEDVMKIISKPSCCSLECGELYFKRRTAEGDKSCP